MCYQGHTNTQIVISSSNKHDTQCIADVPNIKHVTSPPSTGTAYALSDDTLYVIDYAPKGSYVNSVALKDFTTVHAIHSLTDNIATFVVILADNQLSVIAIRESTFFLVSNVSSFDDAYISSAISNDINLFNVFNTQQLKNPLSFIISVATSANQILYYGLSVAYSGQVFNINVHQQSRCIPTIGKPAPLFVRFFCQSYVAVFDKAVLVYGSKYQMQSMESDDRILEVTFVSVSSDSGDIDVVLLLLSSGRLGVFNLADNSLLFVSLPSHISGIRPQWFTVCGDDIVFYRGIEAFTHRLLPLLDSVLRF